MRKPSRQLQEIFFFFTVDLQLPVQVISMCCMFSISKWPFNIYHFSVSCQGRRCSWLYALGLCVSTRVWPKHIIMQHLLGQRSSNVWPVTHDGAVWLKKNGSGMKWKCLDSQSFSDKRLKDYQVYDWFHRAASNHPITWGHCRILRLSPFPPPQGQTHIYPLSVVSGRRVFHAHFVLTQSIPNPISNSSSKILPSIKCTHVGPRCLTVVSQTAFACWCGMKSLCSIQDKDL